MTIYEFEAWGLGSLGPALRNVVSDCRKRKITLGLGGHGRDRLKQITIKRLQVYYTRAIRSNRTVEAMRKAIMASVHHGFSTDSEPCHEYCPHLRKVMVLLSASACSRARPRAS